VFVCARVYVRIGSILVTFRMLHLEVLIEEQGYRVASLRINLVRLN
jgi:hypothetical protein